MGLFDKSSRTTGQLGTTTLIAKGAVLTGEIALTSNIQIDGKITGTLRTDAHVTISPTGHVNGSIFADKAFINGCFEGEIFASSVEILNSGNLKGDVTCTDLTIQKGGLFLGTSKTVSSEDVVTLSSNKGKGNNATTVVKDKAAV